MAYDPNHPTCANCVHYDGEAEVCEIGVAETEDGRVTPEFYCSHYSDSEMESGMEAENAMRPITPERMAEADRIRASMR